VSKQLKNIGVVSGLTVVSRVLGLARDQLGAAVFGSALINSAFLQAFRLPNLFRRLLGEGSLTAALLPTLQEELHLQGKTGAFVLLNKVMSWLLLVTGALVALGMIGLSQSRLFLEADSRWILVADLTVILLPYLSLVCVAAALNAALHVFERFTEPALSPVWLNVSMIVTLGAVGLQLADTPEGRMNWLCAGVILGGILQVGVPAVVLLRDGWRPRPDFKITPRIREIARLMAPGFVGSAIYQVNIYVAGLLAYKISDSAGTLLFYSNRVMELPIGVFAIAVSTVIYPALARHAAARNHQGMAEDYRRGIRLILMINVPAAAGLVLLAEPIVRTLFQHGSFTAQDTVDMTPLLALFAVGMPFFSITSLTVRAFYALKDTAGPVRVAGINFVVYIGLSLLLMEPLGAQGLVLASTIAVIVQTLLLKRALARKVPDLNFGPLWTTLTKVIIATGGMSVVVRAGEWFLPLTGITGRLADGFTLGVLIPLGVVVYGMLLWFFRVEGRDDVIGIWQRFRRRSS